ncbi:MAG: phosphoesterase [Piscirickettsiaceae bacterium]|nr:MAG: phosphoesterase [Piscirickettsiaceae bacterium]
MEVNGSFYRSHLLYPLLVFTLLAILFEVTHVDLALGDWLFNLEGGKWSLRDSFFFSTILHEGAQTLFKVIIPVFILIWGASFYIEKLKPYRKVLLYFAIIVPLCVAWTTNIGKLATHVDCPWDLIRYGGEKPYLSVFSIHPGTYAYGKCFPAGHSSIGFSLLSLYFVFLELAPKKRFYGLAIGVIAGLLFGVTQQLRGAHFISHDLWTAGICWLISLMSYLVIFKAEQI